MRFANIIDPLPFMTFIMKKNSRKESKLFDILFLYTLKNGHRVHDFVQLIAPFLCFPEINFDFFINQSIKREI